MLASIVSLAVVHPPTWNVCDGSVAVAAATITNEVRASLIPAYRPCEEGHAAYCAGPIPPDPSVVCAVPGPAGDCVGDCRAACRAERWDPQCGFGATTGKGEIVASLVGDHAVSVSVNVAGITGCEDETLCLAVSSRQAGLDPGTCSAGSEPDIILDDIPPGRGSSCCLVRNGVCRFARLLRTTRAADTITAGGVSVTGTASIGRESRRGSLWRSGRPGQPAPHGPAFISGLALGGAADRAVLSGPAAADRAEGPLVEGYQAAATSSGGTAATAVAAPNDPKCRFGPNGSGKVRIRVTGTTATVKVDASGISCDAEGVQLCLTASQQVTTTDCGTSPGPCTLVTVFDDPVGIVDRSRGCCTVTSSGACHLRGDLETVIPGAVKPDKYYLGSFGGGGLQRITSIGGDAPLHDTLPAFEVGLLLP